MTDEQKQEQSQRGTKNMNYYVRHIDNLLNDAAGTLSEDDFIALCSHIVDDCRSRYESITDKH
jgi:hypothetical protein